jgi:hypothetical protein
VFITTAHLLVISTMSSLPPEEKVADAPIHDIGDSCLAIVCTFLDWDDHFSMMLVDKRCHAVASSPPSWDTVERVLDDRNLYRESYDLRNFTFGFKMKPRCLCLCFFGVQDDENFATMLEQMTPAVNMTQLVLDAVNIASGTMIPPFLHLVPNLQYLVISDGDMDETTFAGVSTLRYLQHLELGMIDHAYEPTPVRLHPDARINLKHLHLDTFFDPAPLLADLQGDSVLTVLLLSAISIMNVALATMIVSMTSLTELVIDSSYRLTDDVLDVISTSPSLKRLTLINCNAFTTIALKRLLACNFEVVTIIDCRRCLNNCDHHECECNTEAPLPTMVGNTRVITAEHAHVELRHQIKQTPRCQRWLKPRTRPSANELPVYYLWHDNMLTQIQKP